MVLSAAAAQTAITKTSLNLREAPSASAPIRQVLEAGRTVYIWNEIFDANYNPDWSQVLIGNQVGWVKSDYLSYEKAVRVGSFDDAYFGQAARVKEAFKLKFNPDPEVALDTEWLVRVQKVNEDYFVRRNNADLLPYAGDPLSFRQKPTVETSGDTTHLVFSFPALTAGGYVVSLARASSPNAIVSSIPLYISNLSVVTKNTPDQVHFWAVDVKTGLPVQNADVQMFTLQGGQLVSLGAGKTGKQGTLSLKAPRDQKINYLVTDGTSQAYTPPENTTPVGEAYRTLVLTDRPLYQQTDTVQITGVARQHAGGGYKVYSGPATLRLIDPQGNTIFNKALKLDNLGAFREDLPMNFSSTGTYRAEVVISTAAPFKDQPTEDVSFAPFLVQPYVKPSFDLTLGLPEEVLAGEATLKLQSTLYSGGKTNAKVDVFSVQGYGDDFYWGYENSRGGLTEEDYQDNPAYELYGGTYDPTDTESRVAQTTLQNGEGSVKLQFKPRDSKPTPYHLTVRALDEFGRKVVAQKQVMVYPSNLVLTASVPNTIRAKAAVPISLHARKVGSSQAVGNQSLEIKVIRSTWEWDTQKQEWKEKVLQTYGTQVKTDASGKATLNFTPTGSGSIRMEVSARDEKNRAASMTQPVGWIPEETVVLPANDSFEISTPGQAFKVGDTVPVTLTSNLPKDTLVWLTAESSTLLQQQQVKITGKETKATLKITPDMQPGFWVNAVYHRAGKPVTVIYRSFVHVPAQGKNLQVKVTPEKNTLKPGESSRVRVETSLNGKPVSAWVTVGAVNEAVYALVEDAIPDPWRYFWGVPYGLDVNTTTSLPAGFPPENGGGGGDMAGAFPRSRFKDTAFFQSVTTDKKGVALVNFTLPEDVAQYRILARGVTPDTATGESRSAIKATLGFYVRLSAPTFLTHGDETTVYTTVHNQTKDNLQVAVSFKLPSGTVKKTVAVEANGMTVVPWIIKAPEAASLTLETSATSGTLSDAVSVMVPVRDAGTDFELTRTGEANGNALEKLNVPPTADQAQIGVFVAASPLLGAVSTLDDLIREDEKNPLDAVLAAYFVAQAKKALGLDPVRAQALLRQNLQHLMAQQGLDSGGFAWASGKASTFYTLEALTAIGQTLSDGLDYSQYNFRYALNYLKDSKTDSSTYEYQKMLHFMGQDNNLKTFSPRTPEQAAELAFILQDQNLYRTALKDQMKDSQGLSIDSKLEATSYALLAALQLKKDEAKDFARWLAAKLQGSTPRSTAQSALASFAVAAYLQGAGMVQLSEPVTVNVNGKTQTLSRIPALGTTLYFDGKPGQNTVQISSSQPYFYSLNARYLTASAAVETDAFSLERNYSTTTLKDNATTEVRLKIKLKKPVQHLKLTDPIPAGFETLDPSAYQDVQPSATTTLWASKEHLDGATVIYLDDLKAGEYTISYKLRSLAPGTYTSAAPSLIDPDTGLKASGKATVLTVKP
ncbi:hypothetical protein DC3_00520 [Deinococcus cellulosilyticus NBRC 106333 = KACC 11606]|uniref:SH3b domain-containing protein n=2 Tax=Deinococcus cellulosilyticus TaxID=401558 RepID=A0A511MW67_DEIC1|nr:hypothetical protein DC3_00520 [Deinococcus cellulosilyticus NBRC 106333 = KACC 11606]